ncbi:Hypothetical Protein RradSPS_1989 [Rubrobacter radiotolerans]|uniref:DUF5872 domain-containing protein n=1 Tax=Rubrobacter radiotolerans TaxID=42256 RepID=A0A023X474_RUBRA|nr:hypothetical protein [Rubrobacter radiotolerans]AHY47272.1 Hypothetical Protein RradSPS_1989 [Rubrobacter radiotolerans]MDX5894677.1 hypothetical protein [Rubrobacter radiotolerans]SMC06521.1 conserved hypothetical protein [Rubrobacter radiotolerans DSM 5868]
MAKKDYSEKYTHPDLRERLKEEIKESDRGGKPGQWSARKSQLLTQEYEKHGGGYKGEKDSDQKNLEKWTAEEWQTKEGSANAREGNDKDSETARYLPKEAWENMSEQEKEETDRKKREASKKGEQYVSNTEGAKQEGKKARSGGSDDLPLNDYDGLNVDEVEKKVRGLSKDDVETLLDYEKKNQNRKTLIEKLESRL